MGDPAEETCRSPNQVDAKNVAPDCQRTVRNEIGPLRQTCTFRPFLSEFAREKWGGLPRGCCPIGKVRTVLGVGRFR